MDDKSKDLTTFLTPYVRFRLNRTSFGINSIPDHYNRRMIQCFQGSQGHTRLIDDVLMYGCNDVEHHDSVCKFLERCRTAGLRLREHKFEFKKCEIEFAGLMLSNEVFRIHPDKWLRSQSFLSPRCSNLCTRFMK